MKDNDQKSKGEANRSFAQEMQLAFTDWVQKLPFIAKRNLPEYPALENPGGSVLPGSLRSPPD
jgi:hypothetical protein